MIRVFLYFLLSGILMYLCTGCAGGQKLSNKPLAIYNHKFSIPVQLYQTKDVATVLIQLPFGEYDITLKVFDSINGKSVKFNYENEIKILDSAQVFSIELPSSLPNAPVTIRILDLENQRVFEEMLFIKDWLSPNRQHLQVLTSEGESFFGHFFKKNTALVFDYSDSSTTYIYIDYSPQAFGPAFPPQSTRANRFEYDGFTKINIKHPTQQPFHFKQEGLYLIKDSPEDRTGIFLLCIDKDFPSLTNIDELILSIRYITKNLEYNSMLNASDKKVALDEFWLARSSSKERARSLIKSYYNRIRQANKYFTSYKPGWKTDRGLIYTIFGPPEKVEKTLDYEYWYYDYNTARPEVSFFFDRVDEQLILRRSPLLERAWNGQIHLWRQGIIP